MSDPKTILFSFVMERLATEPASVRAPLYRALADYAGDPAQSSGLLQLAHDIERSEARHRELTLVFQGKRGGQ